MTTTELVDQRPAGTLGVFAGDPRTVLDAAREIAGYLGKILVERRLVKRIGANDYVLLEGWTLLGSMVGVFAEIEWTRPMLDEQDHPIGWEARARARTVDGRAISAAEAMCARDEATWRSRDEYALRSMAQTRAISKALRLPLGFVIELAGYNATPAEEVPAPGFRSPERPPSVNLRRQIDQAARLRDIGPDVLREIADEVGVKERATQTQLRSILARVDAMPVPGLDDDDLPDVPDVEEIPNDDQSSNAGS